MIVKLMDILKEAYRNENFNDMVTLSSMLLIVKDGIENDEINEKLDTFIRECIDELKDVKIEIDLEE